MAYMVENKDGNKVAHGAKPASRGGVMKLLGSKAAMLVLVSLVAVILFVTSFSEKSEKGPFDRKLERLNTCKDIASLAERNNCYRDIAFSSNHSYFCAKVFNSSSISDSCYAKLAIMANSKAACYELEDIKPRGYCTAQLAINRVELPLCDNIEDKGWKNYCYGQVAIATKKPDACGRVELESDRADCYIGLAKNISSGSVCAYIQALDRKDECFLTMGSANSDQLLCAEIVEPSQRWTCYHRVAVATGDATLCNRIPPSLNANCFTAVKRAFPDR